MARNEVFRVAPRCREHGRKVRRTSFWTVRLGAADRAGDVIHSLRTTGQLPSNYMTKGEAAARGWQPGKALGNSVPSGQVGGDVFVNSNKIAPSAPGRVWYEADIGISSTMSRAKQPGTRLLYSNDGLLYVTPDHYYSAHPIGRWKLR